MRITHVTDAMGTGGELFGKERVIRLLMHAQRDDGLDARLITFAPSPLGNTLRDEGFPVTVLEPAHRRLPLRALPALLRALAEEATDTLHSHGYKANVVARAVRLARAPVPRLIATCHGWFPDVEFYNRLDRATSPLSDAVTVTDPGMLARFPKRTKARFIANAIADAPAPDAKLRTRARAAFGFADSEFVIGTLCRATETKGVLDVLECARRTPNEGIVWALAGGGPLSDRLRDKATGNARYLGHLDDPAPYRAALDAYLQASYVEGLSLSLLECMRDGVPIVATDVNATSLVITNESNGILIRPGDIAATIAAARRLRDDPVSGARLGGEARARFEREFRIERQHAQFLELYTAKRA